MLSESATDVVCTVRVLTTAIEKSGRRTTKLLPARSAKPLLNI